MTKEVTNVAKFGRAIKHLRNGLERYNTKTGDDQLRDGLVKRYEFTFQLANSLLKRYLLEESNEPLDFSEVTFQDLIRTGNAQGLLLGNVTDWRKHRELRTLTSHVYLEDAATQRVAHIPKFLEEVEFLYRKLSERLE